jgi:hypothetical protein
MNLMMRKLGYMAVPVLAIVAGVFYLGCTGTDVIESPVGELTLSVEPMNTGMSRFDNATMRMEQFWFRPVDPQKDALLGSNDYGVLTAGLFIDLNSPTASLLDMSMDVGTYRVTRIRFGEVFLSDSTPPAVPSTCMENFGQIATPEYRGAVAGKLYNIVFDEDTGPRFTLSDGNSTVRLQVDAQAIIEAYVESFLCRESQSCQSGTVDAPCLEAFFENPLGPYEGYLPQLADSVTISQ